MMSAPHGYHGRFLEIDVGKCSFAWREISSDTLRQYLGGVGLGTYLLNRLQDGCVDPLSPESILAFVFSPLVGSALTTSAKFAVVSKSPQTNRINDSLSSSRFAIAGKRTGADAIVLRGQSDQPIIVSIDDSSVQFLPAAAYWGMECSEAERRIRDDMPASDAQVAVIGPAGENLVKYATISNDGRHAGRGGHGAVMGSKNVKALVVRGQKCVTWAQPAQLNKLAKELSAKSFGPATAKYRELGTAANLLVFNRLAMLPTRNFQQGQLESASSLAPETLEKTLRKTRKSCAACTIGCEHLYEGKQGESPVRIEYESLFALGANCGINDPQVVLNACRRCDALGLDTISTGGTIAFAMECAAEGLLPSEESLTFGDGEGLLRLIEQIGRRQGIGHRLADGSKQMAQQLGPKAEEMTAEIKGLEMPGYEPRGLTAMAVGLAVAARGADHNRSGAYEADFAGDVAQGDFKSAVQAVIDSEDRAAVMDSLILCKFIRGVLDDFYDDTAALLQAVTGWDIDRAELRDVARRIVHERRQFNVRAGWTPLEDTLPTKMFQQPVGIHEAIDRKAFSEAVREYNFRRQSES